MSVKVQKIPLESVSAPLLAPVKVVTSGNVIRVTEYEKPVEAPPILKLDKDRYQYTQDIRDCVTGELLHFKGEVCEYRHTENRAQNRAGISRSLAKLRDIINANVASPESMRWVTLTYAENMTDVKRLYEDFKNFQKRFVYYLEKRGMDKPEYIAVVEPQGRGAWHMHILYIWPAKAPFLDNNSVFAPLWGHGFTKIKAVNGSVDNVGAYFSAYLCDMPLEEYMNLPDSERIAVSREGCEIVEKSFVQDGKPVKKRIIKGVRFRLYPPGTKIFRTSRGVKRPYEEILSSDEAKKKVEAATSTFSVAYEIQSVSEKTGQSVSKNKIVKMYYNVRRSKSQAVFSKIPKKEVSISETRCCSICGSVLPVSDFPYLSSSVCYCRECLLNWDRI